MMNSRGSALAVALSTMFLFGVLGVGAINYSTMQRQVSVSGQKATQAFWLADAGLQQSAATACGALTDTSIGTGTYRVDKSGTLLTSTGTVGSGSSAVSRKIQANCTPGASNPFSAPITFKTDLFSDTGVKVYSDFSSSGASQISVANITSTSTLTPVTIPPFSWSSVQCSGGIATGTLNLADPFIYGTGGSYKCSDMQLAVPSAGTWHISGNQFLWLTKVTGTREDILPSSSPKIQIDAAPYVFEVPSPGIALATAPKVGDVYKNNNVNYTLLYVPPLVSGKLVGQIVAAGDVAPLVSGSLTKSGSTSIVFTRSYNIIFHVTGAPGTLASSYTINGVTYTVRASSLNVSGVGEVYAVGMDAPPASGIISGSFKYDYFSSYNIVFEVSGLTVTPAVNATYTNNGITYTVRSTSVSGGKGQIYATGTGSGVVTTTSGTAGILTKVGAVVGDTTVSFTSFSAKFPSLTIFADGRITLGGNAHNGNVPSGVVLSNGIQKEPRSFIIYSRYASYAFEAAAISPIPLLEVKYNILGTTDNSIYYTAQGATPTTATGRKQLYAIGNVEPAAASGSLVKVKTTDTGASPVAYTAVHNYNTVFEVAGITTRPDIGASYTNGGTTYTIVDRSLSLVSSRYVGQLFVTGNDVPSGNSGTLTKVGTTYLGDNSISFTSNFDSGNGVEIDNDQSPDFYGLIYAPGTVILMNQTEEIFGAIVGNVVGLNSGAIVHYDPTLTTNPVVLPGTTGGNGSSGSLTNWQEVQ
ncbi:MAG: pilus assembly PilX N-terminal domain-containing protein [Candidatus Omnitrophota bacterium]